MGSEEMYLSFISRNQLFSLNLQPQEDHQKKGVIDGRRYKLCGDEPTLQWLKTALPTLSQSGMTIEELKTHLQKLDATDIVVSSRIQSAAAERFLPPQEKSAQIFSVLTQAAEQIKTALPKTCPAGAGSMVMISTLAEGSHLITAGARSVEGGTIDGQTAAIIGSGAKMFTALCSLALISQGALNKKTGEPISLDTKVSDVFSEKQMQIFDDQEKAHKLTLGMLLSHTSGLIYYADDDRTDHIGMSLSDILNTREPGSVKFYGNPGNKIYSYSNHIGLAAAMIEIACEKPYAEVLKEQVLNPLGMTRTSYDCPKDDNVLLAYQTPPSLPPTSARKEVLDPMMQGAGGLWSCMDDMAKLGKALGIAMKEKSDLLGNNDNVVIDRHKLQAMITPQTINAPCGFALDLEGDAVGKGGGIHGYDFKFTIDISTGNCISMMCNHGGRGDFGSYLATTKETLKKLNPNISLPELVKQTPQPMLVKDLSIEECSHIFKGFAGMLALPNEEPLTRINFNGTTLPVKQLPKSEKDDSSLTNRYVIAGDSPFHGKELHIYQRDENLLPCFVDGMEVWSFGEVPKESFPNTSPELLLKRFEKAIGNYIDPEPGPPVHQIRIDPELGLTLSFPGKPPAKTLITALSEKAVCFRTCVHGGPQDCSFSLEKEENSENWHLIVRNGETDKPIRPPYTKQ